MTSYNPTSMKVLLINGSPRRDGNTHMALTEVANSLQAGGVQAEIYWIGNKPVQGCIACGKCKQLGRCVFKDDLYEGIRAHVENGIDGLIIGSPTYYAGPAGSLCAILDRVFYSLGAKLQFKPAASVVVARRGGASTTYDRLNKYFTILNMPVVSSQYWNMVYGALPGEVSKDGEGMQTMRTLGANMAWLIKGIAHEPHPKPEQPVVRTNFIR